MEPEWGYPRLFAKPFQHQFHGGFHLPHYMQQGNHAQCNAGIDASLIFDRKEAWLGAILH
ncbi:hypothetical protein [Desulfovibrio desulfuricans]|uniref:hypothetical protein n=1 Tax=Desulfovibrio desulfuricans TaxID=876 RepID=UPI001454C651|nr:hypothetical protein [Desulfovibrio desulfuricans]